jgi:NADH:ubiquinone oxidoreductase subunit K
MNLQAEIPLDYMIMLSTIVFFVGLLGVIIRRNLISMLMGVELMLNAVNINFVAFNHYLFPHRLEGHFFRIDSDGHSSSRSRHCNSVNH